MASKPSAPFTDLPVNGGGTFFGPTEDVKGHLIPDMSRGELETFIDQLDPDEVTTATDVLGFFVFFGLA